MDRFCISRTLWRAPVPSEGLTLRRTTLTVPVGGPKGLVFGAQIDPKAVKNAFGNCSGFLWGILPPKISFGLIFKGLCEGENVDFLLVFAGRIACALFLRKVGPCPRKSKIWDPQRASWDSEIEPGHLLAGLQTHSGFSCRIFRHP